MIEELTRKIGSTEKGYEPPHIFRKRVRKMAKDNVNPAQQIISVLKFATNELVKTLVIPLDSETPEKVKNLTGGLECLTNLVEIYKEGEMLTNDLRKIHNTIKWIQSNNEQCSSEILRNLQELSIQTQEIVIANKEEINQLFGTAGDYKKAKEKYKGYPIYTLLTSN